MGVHLFGAVWSPSCVTFTVPKNADDCLKSLPTSSEAVWHVDNLRKLMLRGGFNLTKWISNDRKVLKSISLRDRAKNIKELDLTEDILPVERALGVSLSVGNDK